MELWNISKLIQLNKGKEKGYNKGDVMTFFVELLSFCEQIRSVRLKTGSSLLCLATVNEEVHKVYKEIDTCSQQFGEDITEWFWNLKKGTSKSCRIIVHNSNKIFEEDEVIYERQEGEFSLTSSIQQDEKRLNQIALALDCAFMNEETKSFFVRQIEKLRNIYIQHVLEESLWKRKDIFEYLNVYYELLRFLMCENNLLDQKEIKDNILMPLLQMGMIEYDKKKLVMTFQAPVILSILNVIYSRLNDFVQLQLHEGTTRALSVAIQSVEKDMYREIFLSKISQIFRCYFVLQPEGNLYQTRVAVYDARSDEGRLEIPIVNMAESECFQGIRELRLGEKILFELKNAVNCNQGFFKEEYRIVLVGEVEKKPLEELIKYVVCSLKRKSEYKNVQSMKLKFIAYSYANIASGSCCGYDYEFRKYTDFSVNTQQMKKLLDEGELIFFVDNYELYDLGVEEASDIISFKQYISIDTYEEYFRNAKNDGLNLKCKFMDLYNVLTMYLWKGKIGTLKRSAKISLVQYIKEYVKDSSVKAVYIYVSDIDAFKGLNCIKEEFVRIEKYNQKEIGIIRFTTSRKERLPVKAQCKEISNRNIIVFNLWQFVKHILLNHWEHMQKLYVDSKDFFLDDIYIGMDYTNWKSGIDICYWFEGGNDLKKEYIRQTVELLIEQVAYRQNPNMYQRYLKNAFVSFLYGSAKSIEDLVFLHVFKEYAELLGEYRIIGEDPEIKEHYNLNCKYSHKKNYWEATELFDRDNVNIINQYRVLNLENSGDQEDEFLLNKLSQACINIDYQDSELYKRCKKYSL